MYNDQRKKPLTYNIKSIKSNVVDMYFILHFRVK